MPVTRTPYESWPFEGRRIRRETPIEIVAKKVWYRGHEFRLRDVFDLACLLERDEAAILEEGNIFLGKREILLPQLHAMKPSFESQIREMVDVMPRFEALRDQALDRVIEFYETVHVP